MNTFDSNLVCLAIQDPALADAVRAAGGGLLQIAPARNGMPTATAAGLTIHSAYDPMRESMDWAEMQASGRQSGEIAVVLGVGLLYHVEALRRCLPQDARVAVVVPDLRMLHDACAARPMDGWARQVEWLWGTPEDIASRLAGLGPLRFLTHAPSARLHADAHAELERHVRSQLARHAGGRLHIAVVGPIYGGSLPVARYTVSALEELGHRVTYIDHSAHDPSYRSMADLKAPRQRLVIQSRFADLLGQLTVARLAEEPPDLVLALAQAPLSLPILEHLRRKKFLTAMWFVENHRYLTYWQQVAAGYDHWFVIQRGACEDALRRAGARSVAYLPMAADPSVHRPIRLTGMEWNEFKADVSFVGTGYANRRGLLPALVGHDWTFKLWGDDWDGAHELAGVLQRDGRRIDTETCIKVFNATKINLNLHSFIGQGLDPDSDFVNPRTFELAACGAFQLVDQRALLPEMFTPDEMAIFHRADALPARIKSWLHDTDARTATAMAARNRVLKEHTYVHRLRDLLAHIGISQPDRVGTVLRGERAAGYLAARESHPDVVALLKQFPGAQRVELRDVAAGIRARGPGAALKREELLLLMLDEYRQETRDLL